MKKLIILIIVICSLLIGTSYSQFTWQRTYHPVINGDEVAYDICAADDSTYYIGGFSAPFFRYAYIVKIDQFGDTLWTKVYGGGEVYTVEPTNDGGCIFAGYAGGAFAQRIKPNGDTLWRKFYNGINFLDMKRTPDGNYILCGVEYSNDRYNGYICKIDISGNVIWEKIYPASNSIDFFTIEPAINNGFIVGGIKRDYPGGPRYSYICKINDTGGINWEKSFFLSIDNYVSGIQAKNNGYLLTGRTMNNAYLLKINVNGDSLTSNIIQNTENIYYTPVLLKENDNKFYLAHINGFESRVYSIDSNLSILKMLTLQNSEGLSILSITKAVNSPASDIILVGITSFQIGNEDAYAVRIDSSLSQPPPIGFFNYSNHLPKNYELHQNYPNPFNPSTRISFTLKKNANIKINVYDIQGKFIQNLVLNQFSAGKHYKEFQAKNLSTGIYFYSLFSGTFSDTKKMVLLK